MNPAAPVALGATGLVVSRLGLGTAPLGGMFAPVSDAAARATVRRAFELGVRLYDTAPLYGYGLAEERTGRALRELPRDRVVLSSKVGRLLRPPRGGERLGAGENIFHGAPDLVPRFDFSHEGALRSLEESLARLGTDRIDILHIHDPDDHYEEALAGAYAALARLRREGVVRAIGAGMNQSAMLARLARAADFDCLLLAGRYTLLDQSAQGDLLPLCAERGIAVLVGGVFNSGLLANPVEGATYDYAPAAPELVARARRLAAVCAHYDVPLKAAALQFPFGHEAVTSVVVGARSPSEIEENARLLELPVPAELWEELRRERLLGENVPVPADAQA